MCRHGFRTHFRSHHSSRHESDTHQYLLNKHGIADFDDLQQRFHPQSNMMFNHIRNTDKSIFRTDRDDAHHACHYRTEYRSNGGSGDSQCRESEMAVDQQVIAADIHQIGDQIRPKGDHRIARAALCRIDSHGQYVEDHATHDDPVVSRRHGMRVLTRSAEFNNLIRESHRQCTDDHRCHNAKADRHHQNLVGRLLPLLSKSSRHQGGDCYIRCDEQCQPQELRLCGQPYRCHRIGSERTHHKSIHHTRQCDKKGFADRRPRQPDCLFCQGTLCVFCAHSYVTYYLFLDISCF